MNIDSKSQTTIRKQKGKINTRYFLKGKKKKGEEK